VRALVHAGRYHLDRSEPYYPVSSSRKSLKAVLLLFSVLKRAGISHFEVVVFRSIGVVDEISILAVCGGQLETDGKNG